MWAAVEAVHTGLQHVHLEASLSLVGSETHFVGPLDGFISWALFQHLLATLVRWMCKTKILVLVPDH